ncbi:MAG: hypothetical protein NTY66_00960, partial [Candidatus Vogelbacteria bacterium]|nr:hypothetical protein [Candidatus Vogelbacteria bacterium]
NGTIGKNVTVRAQMIVFGPQAYIIGDFSYQSSEKAQIASSARIAGKTTFSRISGPERYSWGNTLALLGLAWLLKLIAFAVAVLALFFLLPRRMMQLTEAGTNAFWRELVRGFVVLVVWPVALFILFFSVVGWVLALIGLFAYLFLLFASAIVTVFITAGLLQKYAFKGSAGSIDWPKLLLATVVLFLIGLIPVVGWFIVLAIYLSAIGVTARLGYDLARR